MLRVASIVSTGHSGSTLLDCVMGSIPGVFSTGEVTYLPLQIQRRGADPPTVSQEQAREIGDVCSCLSCFRTCSVWAPVVRRLSEKSGFDIFQDPLRFKIALLAPHKYVARDQKPWTHFARLQLPRFVINTAAQHRALNSVVRVARSCMQRTVRNNWLLFDTIAEVMGTKCTVDSSKDLLRFLMLHAHRPSDIRMVFLIRDIRGVALSFLKRKQDPIVFARHWVRYNNRIMSVVNSDERIDYQIVLYEDLARDPVGQRRRLASFLGLPDPGDEIHIDTRERHLVAGNPMKYQGNITIRHDRAWREELDPDVRREIDKISQGLSDPLKEIMESLNGE